MLFYDLQRKTNMPFNTNSLLWCGEPEAYFQDRVIPPIEQEGPHCVSTVLAMLSGVEPERFQGVVNTQDPVSWSEALREYGLKLAYCPSDNRKVRFYVPELVRLDDLFTVSYFTPTEPAEVLRDPRRDDGWVCGSHIVILHGKDIIDPARGDRVPVLQHRCMDRFTKRIFRVVPKDHPRGL
jgi:hypothetical protein